MIRCYPNLKLHCKKLKLAHENTNFNCIRNKSTWHILKRNPTLYLFFEVSVTLFAHGPSSPIALNLMDTCYHNIIFIILCIKIDLQIVLYFPYSSSILSLCGPWCNFDLHIWKYSTNEIFQIFEHHCKCQILVAHKYDYISCWSQLFYMRWDARIIPIHAKNLHKIVLQKYLPKKVHKK